MMLCVNLGGMLYNDNGTALVSLKIKLLKCNAKLTLYQFLEIVLSKLNGITLWKIKL